MKKIRNNKGITLIALVVTIIVLIILAGVSINLVLGDNGILTKAKEAKDEYKEAEFKEKIQLAVQEYVINRNTGDNTSLEEKLRENLDESKIEEVTENGKTAVVIYDGERIKIDLEKGTIGEDTPFDIWDGQSASEGLIGKGTKEEPYLIYSANDLNYMARVVNSTITGLNEDRTENGYNEMSNIAKYKLMTNIALNDVSDFENWDSENFDRTSLNSFDSIFSNMTDSGRSMDIFYGEFDGNGYEITGLYRERDGGSTMGLFGYVGSKNENIGTIKNLTVSNAYISGSSQIGIIIGSMDSYSIIENCYASGYVIVESFSGGGIAGSGQGKIINCISNTEVRGGIYIGGIAGKIISSYNSATSQYIGPIVENCYNKGKVSGTQDVGGIVGETGINNATMGEIRNCHNEGIIKNSNEQNGGHEFGGIIGALYNLNINNCSNSGNIVGIKDSTNSVGGIAGYVSLTSNNIEIKDCKNAGNIDGNSKNVGGVVGQVGTNKVIAKLTLINCTNKGTMESTNENVGDIVGNLSQSEDVIIK